MKLIIPTILAAIVIATALYMIPAPDSRGGNANNTTTTSRHTDPSGEGGTVGGNSDTVDQINTGNESDTNGTTGNNTNSNTSIGTIQTRPSTNTNDHTNRPSQSVFVPNWSDQIVPIDAGYDRLIYFGVPLNTEGIVRDSGGFATLQRFIEANTPNQEQGTELWLTVTLLDREIITTILDSPESWELIAEDIVETTRSNDLDGVVLNLEVGRMAFHIDKDEITAFTAVLHNSLQANELPLAVTIYGDTYYRIRPYDIAGLAEQSDELIVMGYDFSKSYGLPGPNFPASGREEFGYDLNQFILDLSADLTPEQHSRVTFALGAYGYEWVTDAQDRPVARGEAVTRAQAEARYLNGCNYKNCTIERDTLSSELTITHTGDNNRTHVIWMEDDQSITIKQQILSDAGITRFATWAWGYY